MKKKIVFFDVDSTLVADEGLDYLAKKKGKGKEVESLTRQAMNGEIPQQEAMEQKMQMISPSRKDMRALAKAYTAHIVEDAKEVIQELKKADIEVGIITGNFYSSVLPLARKLGVARRNVYANTVEFNWNGSYKNYREDPLMTSDGKAIIVQKLRPRYDRMTMVGDGATDLATKPYVDQFIGFGGVARRPKVEEASDVYIQSSSIAPVLLYTLPKNHIEQRSGAPIIQKARRGTVMQK